MNHFKHIPHEDEIDTKAFYLAGYDHDAVSGVPTEPRRYPCVPHCDDELTLVEPAREQVFSYNDYVDKYQKSIAMKNTMHPEPQRQARRRDLALDIGNWVAGVILLAFLGAVVAYGLLGVNVLELVGIMP